MRNPAPLYARDRNAAKLLDMSTAEFCKLVDGGFLPAPVKIGGHERWDVTDLRRIISGDAVDGCGGVDW